MDPITSIRREKYQFFIDESQLRMTCMSKMNQIR